MSYLLFVSSCPQHEISVSFTLSLRSIVCCKSPGYLLRERPRFVSFVSLQRPNLKLYPNPKPQTRVLCPSLASVSYSVRPLVHRSAHPSARSTFLKKPTKTGKILFATICPVSALFFCNLFVSAFTGGHFSAY